MKDHKLSCISNDAFCLNLAVFKWAVPGDDEMPAAVDPFETNEVRILAVTWNLGGKKPRD